MPQGQDVIHSTLTNHPTDATKHQLHSPGFIADSAAEMSSFTNAWTGDVCFRTDINRYFVFFGGSFHIFNGGSIGFGYVWTLDPLFKMSGGTLSWTTGQLVSDGVPYNLTSNNIGPASGSKVIIGTLDANTLTVILSYQPETYQPATGEIIVGAFDIAQDEFISVQQVAQQAKNIIFDPSSTVYVGIDVQGILRETSNIFTGDKVLSAYDFEFTGGHTEFDSSQFVWNNGTSILAVNNVEIQWNNSVASFLADSFLLMWADGVNTTFVAEPSDLFWGNGTTTFRVEDSQLFWFNGTTHFIVNDTTLVNAGSGANSFIVDGTQIRWSNGPAVLIGASNELLWTDGSAQWSSTPSKMAWFSGTGSQFQVDTNQLYWQINSGATYMIVIDSEIYWQGSGAHFQSSTSELHWDNLPSGQGLTFEVSSGQLAFSNQLSSTQFYLSQFQLNYKDSFSTPTKSLVISDFEQSSILTPTSFFTHATDVNGSHSFTQTLGTPDYYFLQGVTKIIGYNDTYPLHGEIVLCGGDPAVGNLAMVFRSTDGSQPFLLQLGGAPGADQVTLASSAANGFQFLSINGGMFFQAGTGDLEFLTSTDNIRFSSASSVYFDTPNAGSKIFFTLLGTPYLTLDPSTLAGTVFLDFSTNVVSLIAKQTTVNSSVAQRTQDISDLPAGGDIGLASTTVDVDSSFKVNQTTAGQTVTLPAPADTISGRIAYVNNVGTTSFSFYGGSIPNGSGAIAMWTGSAWSCVGRG